MMFGTPQMLVLLFFGWITLVIVFCGWRSIGGCRCKFGQKMTEVEEKIDKLLRTSYEQLGPITFFEAAVLCIFLFLVGMWVFRDPQFIPGWGTLFKNKFIKDSTCALIAMVLLFIFPRHKPTVHCFSCPSDLTKAVEQPGVLKWEDMTRFPWAIILLLGGGFAMAEGVTKSGLGKYIGSKLVGFKNLEDFVIILLCVTMIALVTEVASNTATTNMFMPILKELAISVGLSPVALMLSGAIAASFAFMFPVATPPNAIVFASGRMKTLDMMKGGAVMNVICILIVTVSTMTYAPIVFDFELRKPV